MTNRLYGRDLAELHTLYYSDVVENAAPGVIAALRRAGIRSKVILDLGCGGGQLSSRLLHEGYEPVGVDVSPAMIRLARRRAPKARFICGSITDIALPQCSAASAIGEIFNYLPSKAAIRRAFGNIFRSLEPGGLFVFDIKEPLPGAEKKTRSTARWGDDWAIFVEVEEDPQKQRLTRKIVSFRRDGTLYRRHDEVHRQVILEAREAVAMLEDEGFRVDVFPGYGSYALSDDRKVLIARKQT
jgi:SAM-dependent methyltransferase